MNERSIAQSLLRRVEIEARRRHAARVRRLVVRVGELSGVDADLLARAFAAVCERTVCDAAQLEVHPIDARWTCPTCATDVARGAVLRCPRCGAPARLADGGEVVLERIEMEIAS